MKQQSVLMSTYKKQQVVVVDEHDVKIGLADIGIAHKNQGIMHRAISIVLYRKQGNQIELLLQQRSKYKPLWPLFWTNTVCTHPRDGETYGDCAVRRLSEEMGISLSKRVLRFAFTLRYAARFTPELSENELDSVFVGEWNGTPVCQKKEVASYRWETWEAIRKETKIASHIFTPWFLLLVENKLFQKELGVSI